MRNETATSAGRRTERLEARIPAELKDVFVRAAAIRRQSLTDFVLSTVTIEAQRIIRDQELMRLTERDQLAFAAALANPPEPSPRLKDAAKLYKSWLAKK